MCPMLENGQVESFRRAMKSLRGRMSHLSLVQFRLGTLFQCHFGLHTLFLLLGLGLVSFRVRDGLVRVRVEFYFGTCNLNHIR